MGVQQVRARRLGRVFLAVLPLCLAAGCGGSVRQPGMLSEDALTFPSPVSVEADFPADELRTYTDLAGRDHRYRVQEPATLTDDAPVLVFAHGQAGTEDLGMGYDYAAESFVLLRNVMAKRGWIYVTINDYEWDGLADEIRARYGDRDVYLSGASAGGGAVLREAVAHPDRYAGLILLCPAVPRLDHQERLTMPMVVTVGTEDRLIRAVCRSMVGNVQRFNQHVGYAEIAGGGHGDPLTRANWDTQVAFVSEVVAL